MGCVLAPDADLARRIMLAVGHLCDLLELRLDGLDGSDVADLVREAPTPVIASCRRVADGGRYVGSETARRNLLRRALEAGASYVDLEGDVLEAFGETGAAIRIGSLHDLDGSPPDLPAVVRRLREAGADIVKVAVTARDLTDVARILDLLERESGSGPITAHAMGLEGRLSRLVGPRFGAALVYAAPAPGREAAPGQATVHDHRRVLRTHRIGRETRLHAVIGADVARSPSPAVMNAAFEALGVDRAYVPFSCADPVDALRRLPAGLLDGLSVTIPHKSSLGPLLHEVEDVARRTGAVNTVSRDGSGRLIGANTDAPGILDALRSAGGDLRGPAIVVGTGGAARAAAVALADAGAAVVVTGRSLERARAVADLVRGDARIANDVPWSAATVVVQATPLGSRPGVDPIPLDAASLRPGATVLDVVAVPALTPLLREVEACGGLAVSGREMFLAQAARQIAIWTGMAAPTEIMRRAAEEFEERLRPIVLVGLRGAGKTTVGERLAVKLGRAFVDTDRLFEQEVGRTPGDVIRRDGVDRFRALEESVTRDALGRSAAVVALGGGAPETAAIRRLLRGTARVFWLDAGDATLLARTADSSVRPPLTAASREEEVEILRARRGPIFLALAEIRIATEAPATPDSAAAEIVRRLSSSP